ncbi:T9SS type B sorting domain-containing protein [Kriegella sp. EG-1]|nr:T9SS type B sorting domain-containing protein [Flavobacteriaceae bacterium EG-1]
MKNILFILLFIFSKLALSQECPVITVPVDEATNIPVDTEVTWEEVPGVIGYIVSLGTTPGGGEIVNRRSSGQNNFYVLEVGLPENTRIYVTIQLFLFGQPVKTCKVESFVTEEVTTPPPCTSISFPKHLEKGVKTSTVIRWHYAPTATGYRITMGTADNKSNILSNYDVGNKLFYKSPTDFPLGEDIFIAVTPYNENGDLSPCKIEQFSTSAAAEVCDPRFDSTIGAVVTNKPKLSFPEKIAICRNNLPGFFSSKDNADGHRWYKINPDQSETLISESKNVSINEIGRYKYEAYNNITQAVGTIECSAASEFIVEMSELPRITDMIVEKIPGSRIITVITNDDGNHEFAIDNIEGPYQAGNIFNKVIGDKHVIYVRDVQNCGVTQKSIPRDLSRDNFPMFFTPNGDSINDYWQFTLIDDSQQINLNTIFIYDRYGTMLAQIDPNSQGWDGKFRGKEIPSSTYWYKAIAENGDQINGYFALKR